MVNEKEGLSTAESLRKIVPTARLDVIIPVAWEDFSLSLGRKR